MMKIVRAWFLGNGVKVPIRVGEIVDYLKKGEDVGVQLDSGHEAVVYSDGSVFVLPINIKSADDIKRVENEVKKLLEEMRVQ